VKTGINIALRWISLHIVAFAISSLGQGRVTFDNISAGLAPVTISTNAGTFNPADGSSGAYVGSSYSVTLVFVNGTITDQSVFDASNPIWMADALFFGTTGVGPGHGPGGDLSGFFDGGSPQAFGQTSEFLTFQLWAWYNGGGQYTSYSQALAAGHNVGFSNLLPLQIPLTPGVTRPLFGLQPFTVGIPEPSSVSLLLLGIVSLAVFRRGHKLNQ
jgi:hypothetical protein